MCTLFVFVVAFVGVLLLLSANFSFTDRSSLRSFDFAGFARSAQDDRRRLRRRRLIRHSRTTFARAAFPSRGRLSTPARISKEAAPLGRANQGYAGLKKDLFAPVCVESARKRLLAGEDNTPDKRINPVLSGLSSSAGVSPLSSSAPETPLISIVFRCGAVLKDENYSQPKPQNAGNPSVVKALRQKMGIILPFKTVLSSPAISHQYSFTLSPCPTQKSLFLRCEAVLNEIFIVQAKQQNSGHT
ncbi:MAG: hypothetical protein IJU94_03260 [Clostridia bacterium]|nr:hypothetical protein [Clostridia bacterium]